MCHFSLKRRSPLAESRFSLVKRASDYGNRETPVHAFKKPNTPTSFIIVMPEVTTVLSPNSDIRLNLFKKKKKSEKREYGKKKKIEGRTWSRSYRIPYRRSTNRQYIYILSLSIASLFPVSSFILGVYCTLPLLPLLLSSFLIIIEWQHRLKE